MHFKFDCSKLPDAQVILFSYNIVFYTSELYLCKYLCFGEATQYPIVSFVRVLFLDFQTYSESYEREKYLNIVTRVIERECHCRIIIRIILIADRINRG